MSETLQTLIKANIWIYTEIDLNSANLSNYNWIKECQQQWWYIKRHASSCNR